MIMSTDPEHPYYRYVSKKNIHIRDMFEEERTVTRSVVVV